MSYWVEFFVWFLPYKPKPFFDKKTVGLQKYFHGINPENPKIMKRY
jgi:hypothetical protein